MPSARRLGQIRLQQHRVRLMGQLSLGFLMCGGLRGLSAVRFFVCCYPVLQCSGVIVDIFRFRFAFDTGTCVLFVSIRAQPICFSEIAFASL